MGLNIIKKMQKYNITMNETSSLFLATLLLAIGGGAGFYIYNNTKENNEEGEDDETVSENDNVEEINLSDDEIDFAKPKRKSKPKGIKSKKQVKKNASVTKRRY